MRKAVLIALFIGFGFNISFAHFQVDPAEVMSKAVDACKSLKSIVYEINGYVVGKQVKAKVTTLKHPIKKEIGYGEAAIKVEGEIEVTKGNWKPFAFAYKGEDFKMINPITNASVLINKPEGNGVNRMISFELFLIPFFQYTQEKPFNNGLLKEEESMEYKGSGKHAGRSYDAIEITRFLPVAPGSSETKKSSTTWFFDVENHLPIGFKSDPDKPIKWATNMEIDKAITLADFDMEFPEGLNITVYETGMEPISTGLLSTGSEAPDFILNDNTGKPVKFSASKAKLRLIDFWGTWCAPCIRAMPNLQALHDKYGDKGLQVIGISVHDGPGKAEKFIEKKGFSYQFLVQGEEVAKAYKIDTYPTLYLVDQKGKIIHAEKGVREGAIEKLDQLIKEYVN